MTEHPWGKHPDEGVQLNLIKLYELLGEERTRKNLDSIKLVRRALRNAGVLSLPFSCNKKRLRHVCFTYRGRRSAGRPAF